MSDDRVEMRACPWCQGEGFYAQDKCRGQCRKCGALGPFNYDPAKAIAAWNARALDPSIESLQAEVERKDSALSYAKEYLSGLNETGAVADIQALERQALAAKEQTRDR